MVALPPNAPRPRLATTAAGSLRREALLCALAMTALAAVVLGWYVLHGGFYWDDWENAATTRYAYEPGFAGPFDLRQLAYRPVLQILIPATQALFGARPELHLALAALLAVAVSTCFFVLLRTLGLKPLHAGGIAALALVFPWSDATRLWATASLNNVAVCLFLGGAALAVRELERPDRRRRRLSLLAYALSVLTYNVAAVPILGSLLIYRLRAPWGRALRRWRADLVVVGPLIVLATLLSTKKTYGPVHALAHGVVIAVQAVELAGRALWPFADAPSVGTVALAMAAAVAAVALGRLHMLRRGSPERAGLRRWLVVIAGSSLGIGAAYVIFAPADPKYSPLAPGIYNRVSTLAGLGFAALVYALIALAARLAFPRRRIARGAVVAAGAAALATGWAIQVQQHARAYVRAANIQSQVLASVHRDMPRPPRGTVLLTFRGPPAVAPGIPVFGQEWDFSGAAKVKLHRPTLTGYPVPAGVPVDCGSGAVTLAAPGRFGGHAPRLRYGRLFFLDLAAGKRFAVASAAACRRALHALKG